MQIWAQKLLPQHWVSRGFGKLARARTPWLKNFLIRLFIKAFKVNLSEAEQTDYRLYVNFNAFFTRKLNPNARAQPSDPGLVSSPVDGCISALGLIHDEQIFQAKGQDYCLTSLLGGDPQMALPFCDGAFFTAYLSPSDYHRVHMPVTGTLKKMIHVPGRLFSVNPYTVSKVPNLFASNERVICIFETALGPMAVVFVGAVIVASIGIKWHGIVTPPTRVACQYWEYANNPIHIERGDEIGHFEVGSTVIVLFGKAMMSWSQGLVAGQAIQLGQPIANPNIH